MKAGVLLCAALFVAAAHTRANDGFGGIGANGLEFAPNDKVAMVSEDLFISIGKIKVSYVFANTSDEDVTGEIIFLLPPIELQGLQEQDANLPKDRDRENLVNFTVEVDGQSITPDIERRAVRLSPSAGTQVAIRHQYENYPPGGIWAWEHPVPDYKWNEETARPYCIDEATSKALARCKAADQIDYILRTANTWKGPIGKFKLATDKGSPCNILSLCATDIEKTGPTTFVIEKTDYTPPEDLSILIATPEMVVLS